MRLKHRRAIVGGLIVVGLCCTIAAARAATVDTSAKPANATPPDKAPTPAPDPGHSHHGEAFDEGPRQQAYLMAGMPKIDFPVTTKSHEAQAFFNQGVGQLHGFWYFEAERSFRQVAAIDPDCAHGLLGHGDGQHEQ